MQHEHTLSRGEAYRRAKYAAGKRQLSIWLDEKLHKEIEELISNGLFRDRSDLVTEAVKQLKARAT